MSVHLKRIEVPPSRGYIVILRSTVTDVTSRAASIATQFRISVSHRFQYCIKGFSAEMPDATAQLIRNVSDVESVEEDLEIEAAGQTVPWGLKRIGALQSATMDIASQKSLLNVHVFLLDTGVDLTNPDFNVVENKLFTLGQTTMSDINGHGTAMAGVIAAKNNATSVCGVCPGASIHNYKVLNNDGKGFMSYAIAGLDSIVNWKNFHPLEQKIVANLSFSAFTGSEDYTALDRAVKSLVDNAYVTCVVAAGNHTADASYFAPAHCVEAITVGAYNDKNEICEFSNYGSVIDFLAPGENILTAYRNRKTALLSGTSLACAYVCGAVGLQKEKDLTKTPIQIKNALVAYASHNPNANPLIHVSHPLTINQSIFVKEI